MCNFAGMGENHCDNEALHARIRELEQERDDLHKDIEQLCMQQAGSSYIAVATQMHFRRIAGLEQEIENLKKKLAACTKENSILKEELSEAKRIKTHLDQLLKEEVQKNAEVVKQLEYFRGAIANAFADRDHAIIEAERAKENEELISQKLNDAEKRLQELSAGSIDTHEQLANLQTKLEKLQQEMEIYRNIVDKFYKIRQHACRGNESEERSRDDHSEDISWDDKCACLYDDPLNMWSFKIYQDASAADHIAALKKELEAVKADFQNETQMAWQIQKHMQKEKKALQQKLEALEQKKILSDRLIADGISSLCEYHTQQKVQIMNLLDDEKSHLQSIADNIQKVIEKSKDLGSIVATEVTAVSMTNTTQAVDSESLTRALQEKVSALLLLSQQEERHLWEENVHAAVQETVDELQKALLQATEEKVKALMELALLKQEYQQLLEKTAEESRHVNVLANAGERRIVVHGRDGKLKNLWKKTSLKHWLGSVENLPPVAHPQRRSNHSMEDARLQIENATLKESIHSLERLTSNVHKLRLSLMQVKRAPPVEGTCSASSRVVDEIVREAELVRIALGSALPLSWSGEGDMPFPDENEDLDSVRIDSVTAAGLEMVELLTLAAQTLKEQMVDKAVIVK